LTLTGANTSRNLTFVIPYQAPAGIASCQAELSQPIGAEDEQWRLTFKNYPANPYYIVRMVTAAQPPHGSGLEKFAFLASMFTKKDIDISTYKRTRQHVYDIEVPANHILEIWNATQRDLDCDQAPTYYEFSHDFELETGVVTIDARNILPDKNGTRIPERVFPEKKIIVDYDGNFHFERHVKDGEVTTSYQALNVGHELQELTDDDRARHPYKVEPTSHNGWGTGYSVLRAGDEGWQVKNAFVSSRPQAEGIADALYQHELHQQQLSRDCTPSRARRVADVLGHVFTAELQQRFPL
jgi:hypothetical protein